MSAPTGVDPDLITRICHDAIAGERNGTLTEDVEVVEVVGDLLDGNRRDDADRERQHLTFGSISCMSEELFIPYAYGEPVKIEAEDSEDGYPPVVPAYIKTYQFKDFGRDATINVSVNDETDLQLRFSEAEDLIEALARLLQVAGR